MPGITLEVREYDDGEVRQLPERHRPVPFDPYPLNAPARGRGQGNVRRSEAGDRWCPYCQTTLSGQRQSCATCHPVRQDLVASGRLAELEPEGEGNAEALDAATTQLLEAVDQMARVIALASAHQHNGRTLGKAHVEQMFMACKEVIVMADYIKAERNAAS